MKKLITVLITVFLLAGIGFGGYYFFTMEKYSSYKLEVELNPDTKICTGVEEVEYINKTEDTLNEIYFHIYPNAFMRMGNKNTPERCMKVKNVISKDNKLNFKIANEPTALKIELKEALKPGDKIKLNIDFEILIPEISGDFGDRFGYSSEKFNMGNWYPIAAVYDKTGWNLDPYYALGDPFYSEAANYDVKITVPKNYKVAATGNEEVKDNGDKKVFAFTEKKVRDFAFVASNRFKLVTGKVEDIVVKSYYLEGDEEKGNVALSVACHAIEIFNKWYGKYPNKNFSVVETEFPTGMEYPGIVFIGKEYYRAAFGESSLEQVVMHETGHQWWYSTVGNDEIDEAWLDEGFTTFSEILYYQKMGYKDYKNPTHLDSDDYKLDTRMQTKQVILKPLNKFNTWSDYGQLVYRKGAGVLNAIRIKAGDERFFEIMSTYYDRYKFKIATTKDFIDIVKEVVSDEANWDVFFDKWLLDKDEEGNVKAKGKFVNTSYVKADFDNWNMEADAGAFFKKNKGNFVRWTGHVRVINAENFVILQEDYLPEIWGRCSSDVVTKNKIKEGDVVTVFGYLEDFSPSANIFRDPAEWILKDCKIVKTTKEDLKELNDYIKLAKKR